MKQFILKLVILCLISCQKGIDGECLNPPKFKSDPTVIGHCVNRDPTSGVLYFMVKPGTGTPPLQYSVDSGRTYRSNKPGVLDYSYTGLNAAKYYMKIRDSQGCESTVYPAEIENR